MALQRYINGDCRGKEAHSLEMESLRDNLLGDALDGYICNPYRRRYLRDINELKKDITKGGKRPFNYVLLWVLLALSLIVSSAGIVLILNSRNSGPPTEEIIQDTKTTLYWEPSGAKPGRGI